MKVEIRGDSVHISGYVNAVERDSRVLRDEVGPFVERAQAGVFARSLARRPDVDLRFNHGRSIGGVSRGTLQLKEDAVGLHAEADVTDPEVVRAARENKLTGWSFGFEDLQPTRECREGTDIQHRTLVDIDMAEVSILTVLPAYIATAIEARSCDGKPMELRSTEDAVQEYTPDSTVELAGYRLRRLNLEV